MSGHAIAEMFARFELARNGKTPEMNWREMQSEAAW
jgi:hypothetical protein